MNMLSRQYIETVVQEKVPSSTYLIVFVLLGKAVHFKFKPVISGLIVHILKH